ncbi:MAG TPA: hypothetical protein VFY86_02000 [Nocardioides sp.]|nr:hypothetical protein [uncultured Nocardioides sp.]HEX5985263.1 hypothetical protein [Nocardioides sp.]
MSHSHAPRTPAVVDPRDERPRRMARLAERRRSDRARELIALERERPEVVAAYAPADFTVEALRWTV